MWNQWRHWCQWRSSGTFINFDQISYCSGVSIVDFKQVNAGLEIRIRGFLLNPEAHLSPGQISVVELFTKIGNCLIFSLNTPVNQEVRILTEAATGVFLKISHNSQENPCVRVPFFLLLCTCFPVNCEIFKNTYFIEPNGTNAFILKTKVKIEIALLI